MNLSNDPSKKTKPQQQDQKKDRAKKAFREGIQDNNIQEEVKDPVTNASRKVVNSQDEDIIVNKQDKQG